MTYDADEGHEGDPKVTFRLPTWDVESLDALAASTGLTRSELLRSGVRWLLASHPRQLPIFDATSIETSEAITIAEHLRLLE
jgi:hypothetical protein